MDFNSALTSRRSSYGVSASVTGESRRSSNNTTGSTIGAESRRSSNNNPNLNSNANALTSYHTTPNVSSRRSSEVALPPLYVLVVEDSLPILKTITRTLEKAKHTVETAQNGAIALNILKQKTFDVVIMDIQM
jgi:PleD family two-component response regulator